MAASVLSTLYVDVVQRGLTEVMSGLRNVTGVADRGTQSVRQMRDALQQAGRASQGMGAGGGRGGGGLAGMAGMAGGALASVAAPAAIGAAAIGAVKAADPGVFEQLGTVMHDIAGTVGQLLAPAFRAFVPILRSIGDVIAGVADAFKPVADAITSAVMPVLDSLVQAWGEHAGVINSIVLPVVQQFAALLAPLGQVFVTLFQAVAPITQVLMRFQMLIASNVIAVLSAVMPQLTVFAEILSAVGTVFGEVMAVLFDAINAVRSAVGELLAPFREFAVGLLNGVVQGIKMAVAGFKMFIDAVRGLFGLSRVTPIGPASSVGRGMINDAGTEDANSTFQRIQQAILKAGVDGGKSPEDQMVNHLQKIEENTKAFYDWVQTKKEQVNAAVNSAPSQFIEGAGRYGVFGIGGMLAAGVISSLRQATE